MASTSIRFGRGTATRTTRTVNKAMDATTVETLLIRLEEKGGLTFERSWFFDFRYNVSAFGVTHACTQEEFDALLKWAKVDLDCIEKAIYRKENASAQDPMGCLADYE